MEKQNKINETKQAIEQLKREAIIRIADLLNDVIREHFFVATTEVELLKNDVIDLRSMRSQLYSLTGQ